MMLSADLPKNLPPFAKASLGRVSIAPFHSFLKKNPSYFSLVRAPATLAEKKKLKEENWRLKQMLHSLNEELMKLKQKMFQKSEPNRFFLNEGIHTLSQNHYIDVLQDSLRTVRNELKKKKQETLNPKP